METLDVGLRNIHGVSNIAHWDHLAGPLEREPQHCWRPGNIISRLLQEVMAKKEGGMDANDTEMRFLMGKVYRGWLLLDLANCSKGLCER